MEALAQLRLLLHKNWTLRRRQPVILSLELLWPVAVILIAVAVRYAIPPTPKEDCYYKARAQPSAGLLPFVQSYVCTINNTCEDSSSYEEIPTYPESYLNKLLPQVMPLFKNPDVMELIQRLPSTLKLGQAVVDTILQPDVRKILGSNVQLQDFFKDPEHLKSLLHTDNRLVLSPYTTEALLVSTINFPKILSGMPNWNEPEFWICNSTSVQRWLVLPEHADAVHVSQEICSLSSRNMTSILVPVVLQELNWLAIAEKLQIFLRSFNNLDEAQGIFNILRLVEAVVNRKELLQIADKLDGMKPILRLIPPLVKFFDGLHDVNFEFLRTVVGDIDTVTGNKNMSLHMYKMLNVTEMIWKWISNDRSTPTFSQSVQLRTPLVDTAEKAEANLSMVTNPDIKRKRDHPTSLNLTREFDELESSLRYFSHPVLAKLNGSLPIFDVVWKLTAATVHVFLRNDWLHRLPNNQTILSLVPILDVIPAILPQPYHQTLARGFVSAHILLTLAHNITHITKESDSLIADDIRSHLPVVRRILRLGPDTVWSLFTLLSNDTRLSKLIDSSERLDKLFCDPVKLRELFSDVPTNTTLLLSALCKPGVASFLEGLAKGMGVSTAAQQIEEAIVAFKNSTTGTFYDVSVQNFTTLATQAQELLDYITSGVATGRRKWRPILRDLGSEFQDERWQKLWMKFDSERIPVLASLYIRLVQKQLQESSLYEEITKAVAEINHGLDKLSDAISIISNSLKANQSIYWPYAVETFVRTLQDNSKFQRLLRVTDWPKVTCSRSSFWEVLVIPLSVNANELQHFLCNLTTSFEQYVHSADWADILHSKVLLHRLPLRTTNVSAESDTVWGNFTKQLQRFYGGYRSVIQQSREHQYSFHELFRLTRNTFQHMPQSKQLQLGLVVLLESFDIIDNGLQQRRQDPRIWKAFKNVMHNMVLVLETVNQKKSNVSASGKIGVDDITFGLPHLSRIVRKILGSLTPVIEVVSKTVLTNADQLLARILTFKEWSRVPCKGRSLIGFFPFSEEDKFNLRDLELEFCENSSQILKELSQLPVAMALMNKVDGTAPYNETSFKWRTIANTILDLQINWGKKFRTNLTFVPEVSGFSLNGLRNALASAQNFSRVRPQDKFWLFLRSNDYIASFLANKSRELGHNRWESKIIDFLLKSLVTVNVVFQEINEALKQVIGGQTNIISLLGSKVDQLAFLVVDKLDKYLYAALVSVTDISFPGKLHRLITSSHEFSYVEICKNISMLDEIFTITEVEKLNVSNLIAEFCQKKMLVQDLQQNKIRFTVEKIRKLWLADVHISNESITQLVHSFHNITNRIIDIRRLDPQPVLQLGLSKNAFSQEKWRKFQNDVVSLFSQLGQEHNVFALQRSQSAITTTVSILTKEPRLMASLEIISALMRMLTNLAETEFEGVIATAKPLFQNDTLEWGKVLNWFEGHGLQYFDVFLNTAFETPEKLILLFGQANPWQKWCEGNFSSYFTLPANTSIEVSAKEVICNIKWNVLLQQLQTQRCQGESNVTTFATCFASSYTDFYSALQDLRSKNETVLILRKQLSLWKQVIMRRYHQHFESNRTADAMYWIQKTTGLLDSVLQTSRLGNWIVATQHILNWLNTKLKMVQVSNFDVASIMVNYPEIKNLLRVLDEHVLTFSEFWIGTVYSHPGRIAAILQDPSNFCNTTLTDLWAMQNVSGNPDALKDYICQLNTSMLVDDLIAFLDWRSLKAAVTIPSGNARFTASGSLNQTMTSIKLLADNLKALSNINSSKIAIPAWLNVTSWKDMSERIQKNFLHPSRFTSSIISLLSYLLELKGYGAVLSSAEQWLNSSNARIQVILQSGKDVGVESLFIGFPELQKIATPLILKLPLFCEIGLSFQNEQPEEYEKLRLHQSWSSFCNSSITVKLLGRFNESEIGQSWLESLCAVNTTVLTTELREFLAVDFYVNVTSRLTNGAMDFSATRLVTSVQDFVNHVETLVKSRRLQQEVGNIFNETIWSNMFKRTYNISGLKPRLNDTEANILVSELLRKLQNTSLVYDSTIVHRLLPLQNLMKWVTMKIQLLTGSYSKAEYPLFEKVTSIINSSLLELVEECGRLLLSHTQLPKLMAGDFSFYCSMNVTQGYEKNATALQFLLCKVDYQELREELKQIIGSQELVAYFDGLTTEPNTSSLAVPLNITVFYTNIIDFKRTITNLLENGIQLPGNNSWLNSTEWLNIWNHFGNATTETYLQGSSLLVSWLGVALDRIHSKPETAILLPLLEKIGGVIEWLSQLSDNLPIQGQTTWNHTLSRFPNLSTLVYIVNNNVVEVAEVLLTTAIRKPQQLSVLFQQNGRNAALSLCSDHDLEMYSVPHLKTVIDHICILDFPAMEAEIMSIVSWPTLQRIVQENYNSNLTKNSSFVLGTMERLQTLLRTLKTVDFHQPFLNLDIDWQNKTAWRDLADKLRTEVTSTNFSRISVLEWMPLIIHSVLGNSSGIRRNREQSLITANVVVKLISSIGKIILATDSASTVESMKVLYTGRSDAQSLINVLDNLPEALSILITTLTHPQKAFNIVSNFTYTRDWRSRLCIDRPQNIFSLPPDGKEESMDILYNFVCLTNFTQLLVQLDPMQTDEIVKTLHQPFNEALFVQDVDNLLRIIDKLIMKTKEVGKTFEAFQQHWKLFLNRVENISHFVTSADWASLKIALMILGPTLETAPQYTRPVYHRILAAMHSINKHLDSVINGTVNRTETIASSTILQNSSMSVNLTSAIKLVLWWTGCKNEEFNSSCTAEDFKTESFWNETTESFSPCTTFNFHEIFKQFQTYNETKEDPMITVPVPWETVANEIQNILSKLWLLCGQKPDNNYSSLTCQCREFDVRTSLQRLFFTVLSSFPKKRELNDVREAIAGLFSLLEIYPYNMKSQSTIPLYAIVRNQSAFEHHLLVDIGLPANIARSLPLEAFINMNDGGRKLLYNHSSVCEDRKMWTRAVGSRGNNMDQELRKVFCTTNSVSPFLDTSKVIRTDVNENIPRTIASLEENKTTSDTKLHRSKIIESAFMVLRLLDRFEGWQTVSELFQKLNSHISHVLKYTERYTDLNLNWYHLLTNATLFGDFVDYVTIISSDDGFDSGKSIISYFGRHLNETQYLCGDSFRKPTAIALIKSELNSNVGNITALFEVLCQKHPSKWVESLVMEAGIPKSKINPILNNLMIMLPENSSRNGNLNQFNLGLNWNELRVNTYTFANMMKGIPPQFIPGLEWTFWKPFFADSLPAAFPKIAKIIGLRTCSMIEDRSTVQDFSLATIIFHIISNQVQGLPGLQSLTCELPDMNLPALYDHLMQYGGVMETIQGMYNISTHVTQNYTCPEMVEWLEDSTDQVVFYINYYQQPKNVRRMDQCYLRMGQTTAFAELDRYLQLFMNGLDIVQRLSTEYTHDENGTMSHVSFSKIIRSIEDAMTGLQSTASVFIPLRSVQYAEKKLPAELLVGRHLDARMVNVLMDSAINLSKIISINFSIPEMSKLLCNQKEFYEVIRLNDVSDVSYYELRRAICDSNVTAIVTAILSSVFESGIANKLPVSKETSFFKWNNVLAVGNNIDNIFHQFFVLSRAMKKLNYNGHLTKITFTESVITILHENSLQAMTDGLASLHRYLHPLIADTDLEYDLGVILTGVNSLQNITKELLMPFQYNVKQLFTNFDIIASSLTEVFSFNPTDVLAFSQSNLTLSGLFQTPKPFTTFKDMVCDSSQLAAVLSVPNENLFTTVIDSLCNRNDTALDSFITLCADNINFYVIIRQIFVGGLHKLVHSDLLNSGKTEDAFEALPRLGKLLPNITSLLKTFHSMEALSDMLDEFQSTADLMQLQDPISNLGFLNHTLMPSALRQVQSPKTNLKDYVPQLLKVTGNLFCGKPLRNFLDDFSIIADTHIDRLTPEDQQVLKELPTRFCKNLFTQILQMKAGPVIWGYLKPLMRGKILYAPDTSFTRKIIYQANGTMEELAAFSWQLNQWGSGTDTLRSFNKTRLQQFQTALNLTLVREVMEQLAQKDMSLFSSDLLALMQEVHRFDKVLSLVEVFAEAMQCFSLDRFIGLSSERDLEKMAQKLYEKDLFMGGVVFLNVDSMRHSRSASEESSFKVPPEIAYKIRMDIDNVQSTTRLKQWFWRPGPEDNFANDLRYFRGFVQLQEILDLAIIHTQTGNNLSLPTTYTQQFPYPCFLADEFGFFMKGLVPLITTLAMIFVIAFFVRERVLERELNLQQTMQMMGLRSGIHWFSWFISCLIVMVIIISCFVLALRLGNILPISNVAIIYLFMLIYAFSIIMFCYMMSTFFDSATVAALTSVIAFIISYLPFIIILTLEAKLFFWQKILSNLIMSTAFSYGCLYIARYEEQNVGLQLNSIWTSPIPNDDFSFCWSCIMLLCDGVLYFLLGVIISCLRSGNICIRSMICCGTSAKHGTCGAHRNSKRSSSNVHLAFCENDCVHENHLSCLAELQLNDSKRSDTVGISLNKLHKVFDEATTYAKTAIDHLSLEFYENQITTLLGQNGAGKTTTIHLLTGMFSPTSGTSFIYGKDVQKSFANIRKNLGVCPQKNVLFPLFTVREHLEFYSRLKGAFATKQIRCDVDKMLDSMNLWHKQDELVCNLSDGTRRRLCVAIAFIGGSRTIILDEPTSGVDPVARRKIWDLIVAHKSGRTILLTTHHMDEADILSDRVAILHQGKLLCCGSPHFLKSQYGSGYQVTVTKQTDSDSDSDSGAGSFASSTSSTNTYDPSVLLNYFRQFVPNARLLEDHGSEVVFSLPYFSDQGLQNKYDVLFGHLENNQSVLGIRSYGLSCATLEEVFLTVCAEADAGYPITPHDPKNWVLSDNPQNLNRHKHVPLSQRRSSKISLKDLKVNNEDLKKLHNPTANEKYMSGCYLKLHQLCALLKKRSCHTLRDWSGLFSTIFLPCLFVALAMGFSLLRSVGHPQGGALQLTPSLYGPKTNSFFSIESESTEYFEQIVQKLLGNTSRNCSKLKGDTVLCSDWSVTSWSDRDCHCHQEEASCYEKQQESLVVEYVVQNESNIIFNVTGINVSQWILNTNDQFRENRYGGLTFSGNSKSSGMEELTQRVVKVWYNNKGYHALPSYLNAFHNAYLQANMNTSSENSKNFKITTYNHPIVLSGEQLSKETIMQLVADVGVAIVFVVAFSFIPASFIVFVVQERVREEKRLQFVSGVTPLLYWNATFIWNLALATAAVGLSAAVIAAIGLPTYVAGLNLPALLCLLFLYCWATTPLMYILEKLFVEASLASMVLFCVNVFIGVNTMVCTLLLSVFQSPMAVSFVLPITKWIFLIFPQYALGGALVELAKNSIQAEIFARFGRDTYTNPFNLEITGIHMIVLAVQGVVLFIVNYLLECRRTPCCARYPKLSTDMLSSEDSDVLLEKKRVYEEPNNDLLRLYNLTKVYSGRRLAVDNICLGIPRGECFGLLGVNGAGKTTTFRMMTGQLKPTSGTVLYKRHSISHTLSGKARAIGLCPQTNALDDLLTAEELLKIYGKFRGIPSDILPQVVHRMLHKFHLQAYAKRRTNSYSLGTKRKLCVAISLLGNPELVLMDEPTSGMDPSSRRHVWTNILQIMKDKRSVILTSHSMEECDNLCSRIAIMVNGKFQCLGGPQYLKYKFGEGYTVKLRIHDDVLDWGHIIAYVHDHFPLAILKARHCNTIEFLVPTKHITLSQIFSSLESQKDSLGVEDFSVSQTTLDQVFVNFVRQQSDGVDEDSSKKQSRFRHRTKPPAPCLQGYTNSSCSLDDEGISSKERQSMTVQLASRRTPTLSRYNEADFDTTKF